MTVRMRNAIGLMGACLMNNVLYMFLNTFMVAYFIMLTNYNYKLISIYYIFSFAFVNIAFLLLGRIIKNKSRVSVFRVGIILQGIYVLILALLKDNIVNWYMPLGAFYGITNGFFWSSAHPLINEYVGKNSEKFVAIRAIIDKILEILVPIVFGVSIQFTSFSYIAKIVLIVSLMQIAFSLLIKDKKQVNKEKFKLREFFLKFRNNKLLNKYYKLVACYGIVHNLLDTLVTILIVMTFKTVISLGFLTTIFAICSIISIYIYQNKIKNKRRILKLAAIGIVVSIFLLMFNINKLNIVLYNLCAGIFIVILKNNGQAKRYTVISNLDTVKSDYLVECQVFSEIILNISRIVGYITLFIASLFNNMIVFKVLLFLVAIVVCLYVNLILFTDKEINL